MYQYCFEALKNANDWRSILDFFEFLSPRQRIEFYQNAPVEYVELGILLDGGYTPSDHDRFLRERLDEEEISELFFNSEALVM